MEEEKRKEDFATIEPGLNRVFESNEKISPEFKEIARACFGRIFYMLGEKNFKRWIDMKQLNKQLKELVIESMSKEEIENNPTIMGFYRPRKNKIKLSPNYSKEELEDINVHETMHLITDYKSSFCTFLDEGLTEYLKGMAANKSDSYIPNVNSVNFLHEVFGDSLIKSYLIGKEGFDNQMLNLINYVGKSNISEIKEFYSNLNAFHEYYSSKIENAAFARSVATPEVTDRVEKKLANDKQKYEQVKPKILSMYQKIVVGRITEMTRNMQFYKNGTELDLESASQKILELVRKANMQDFEIDTETLVEWRNKTSKLAAEQVLENTHLLASYEGEKREARKQELIDKMAPKATAKSQSKIELGIIKIKNADILPEENSNIVSKLFEKRLSSDMNITQYIETISQIAVTMNISDEELDNLLNKYNIEYFGELGNFKKINEAIKNTVPKIQKLNELQQQRKKDTITSEYKQIDEGKFIEKRDNQIFLVELSENGEFSEQEAKLSKETFFLNDGRRTEVDFSKGLSNLSVKINGNSVKIGKTLSLQDIKEMEIADTFSKEIEKNIKQGKYTKILDDADNPYEIKGIKYSVDIDKRSREIEYDQFISDLNSILKLIPKSQIQDVIESKSEMLLDQAFRIPKELQPDGTKKRSEDVENEYKRFSEAIVKSVGKDTIGKIELGRIKHTSEILSNERKEVVEKNSKTAVVIFDSKTTRRSYNYMKRQQKEALEEKLSEEVPNSFEYDAFYKYEGDIPLDEMPFHLKGVSTTQIVDSRNIKFLYNEFSESAKKILSDCPKSTQDFLFEDIFKKQMQKAFLVPSRRKEMPAELLEALDGVKEAIHGKIFNDNEIDDKKINENLKVLNSHRVEKIKEDKKNLGLKFASKDAEHMFSTFTDLLEIVKKSGIKTDEVTETVKGIMASQMEKEDKQTNGPSMDDE